MADIFWGVSDALDLYGEYLSIRNSKSLKEDKKKASEKANKCHNKTKENIVENFVDNETNEVNQSEVKETYIEEIKEVESKDTVQEKLEDCLPPNPKDKLNIPLPLGTDNFNKIGAGDGPEKVNKLNEHPIVCNFAMNFNPTMQPSCNDIFVNADKEHETKTSENSDNATPKRPIINILIYGGGDVRHIIKTLAKRYIHNEENPCDTPILKFFIIDGCIEIIARNIALLGIALERPELMGLRNKVHLFMDVYGNTLLRPICHQYLVSKSATLLKMVSDKSTLEQIAPFIILDNLKYRERDALQDVFEFWSPKPGYDFNIKDYWICRLRRLLAVRYDCRDGVFDWDLNMSLKSRGAQQICSQEYKYWRETGIAFTFPTYEQSKPNKTLTAGLVRNGSRYVHRGYIGDIQTGPFCTFGLRSAEERLHNSAHGENDYRATEITERNLLEYFYEIQNGSPYEHNTEISNKYGGVRFQMGEVLVYDENDLKGICAYDQPWISVEGVEVHFLSLTEAKPVAKAAAQWNNYFDIAFIGYKYFDLLEDSFPNALRENAILILETKLRSTEIKSRITDFETDLINFARDAKLVPALNYGALNAQNSILKFIKISSLK